MKMAYKLLAQILYRNNFCKQNISSDTEVSFLSICTEELRSVTGDREKMPSTDDLEKVILFIRNCGFDYFNMYIKRKDQNGFETVYTFGYLDKPNEFGVHVEHEQCLGQDGRQHDIVHIGILFDIENVRS